MTGFPSTRRTHYGTATFHQKHCFWRPPKTGKKLKRIAVHIPKKFLEESDGEISGLYTSKNEAIRVGMIMELETIKRRRMAEDGVIINRTSKPKSLLQIELIFAN